MVLAFGVVADFEFLFVGVVAGVDADFLDPFCGFKGGVWLEVDVCDEGDVAACGADLVGDVFEVGGVDFCLGGDADDFAAGVGECEDFCDAGGGVACVGGDHGLDADGVFAADADVSDHDLAGFSPGVAEEVWAVGEAGRVAHGRG